MAYPSDLVRTKDWGAEVLTDADLEAQLDLIINWVMAALNATTGHKHDGTQNEGPTIPTAGITALAVTTAKIANDAVDKDKLGILTTKGDLLVYSTEPAREAVGTDGQILQADSAQASGVKWATAGLIAQVVSTQTGAVATGTTALPDDDTIPQNTEGDQFMSLAITPKSATNKLLIEVVFNWASAGDSMITAALFQDTTAGALAAAQQRFETTNRQEQIVFSHYMTAGTTNATTFKVRAGTNSTATLTFNGVSGARKLGGVMASSIRITEIIA